MSERRCPKCGGLVGAEATFCGQCYEPLGAKEGPPSDPGEPRFRIPSLEEERAAERRARVTGAGPAAFETEGGVPVWACPACDARNPLDADGCSRCGTPFRSLFEEEEAPRIDPARAARLSLLFPGVGHIAAGRVGEGVARAVVFGWTLVSAVAIVIVRWGRGPGPFLPLLALYVLAAAVVYGLTPIDARRGAESQPPVLSSRMLLYGITGLMLLTVVVLLISGLRLTRS